MADSAKTIQLFLPTGDPRRLRIGEITIRIVLVLEVPMQELDQLIQMPEAKHVAVHSLVGAAESDEDLPRLYVGQTGSMIARLTSHQQKKEFWDRALVVVSLINCLTQTHALYLAAAECAKKAAPFVHPMLESVEHSVNERFEAAVLTLDEATRQVPEPTGEADHPDKVH